MAKAPATKTDKADKPKRAPSAYNMFVKAQLAKIKAKETGIAHKDAFKKAAMAWATSPENPKNKK